MFRERGEREGRERERERERKRERLVFTEICFANFALGCSTLRIPSPCVSVRIVISLYE